MEDIQLSDAVERFLQGQMDTEELSRFEQLRKSNPEVDQFVVEHSLFLTQLNEFGERKQFRASLQDIHNNLLDTGTIKNLTPKTKVVDLFKKYRRVWAVAASIAGIIAITVSGLVAYFTPNLTKPQIEVLSREISKIKIKQNAFDKEFTDKSRITRVPTTET